ncbi:MAG: FAD:protein FMN transferase [Phycisphaerae bacterium]|nr:FAD:protein FMN transferase [Phycisphaerae bacterium]
MACQFGITVVGDDPEWLGRAADDAFDEIERIESLLSMYDPTSDLSALNRAASDGPVEVEEEVFELILVAGTIWEKTGGAFDPTMGPVVRLWRRWRAEGTAPDPSAIDKVMQRVGMEHVLVDVGTRTIRFAVPGMEIDLGAIGKGYAVDRALEVIGAYHIKHALVHGGTSTIGAVGSMNSETEGWRIGVTDPTDEGGATEVITLRDEALACSNQDNQYYEFGGRQLGHVIDPRTGWPAPADLSMVVVSASATRADALSTASLVLGRSGEETLIEAFPDVRVHCLSQGATPSAGMT